MRTLRSSVHDQVVAPSMTRDWSQLPVDLLSSIISSHDRLASSASHDVAGLSPQAAHPPLACAASQVSSSWRAATGHLPHLSVDFLPATLTHLASFAVWLSGAAAAPAGPQAHAITGTSSSSSSSSSNCSSTTGNCSQTGPRAVRAVALGQAPSAGTAAGGLTRLSLRLPSHNLQVHWLQQGLGSRPQQRHKGVLSWHKSHSSSSSKQPGQDICPQGLMTAAQRLGVPLPASTSGSLALGHPSTAAAISKQLVLASLPHLQQLQQLDLQLTAVGQLLGVLPNLGALTRLTQLALGLTEHVYYCVPPLTGLQQLPGSLRVLRLTGSFVGALQGCHLSHLSHLEELHLSGTAQLPPLGLLMQQLPAGASLGLTGCLLSSTAVLYGVKHKLVSLTLPGTVYLDELPRRCVGASGLTRLEWTLPTWQTSLASGLALPGQPSAEAMEGLEWEAPYPSPEAYYMYPSSSSSAGGDRRRSGSLARTASSTSSSSGSKGVAERVAAAVPQLHRAKVVLYEDGAGGEGDLGLLFCTLQQLPSLSCLDLTVPPDLHPRQLSGLAALTALAQLTLSWEPEVEEGVSCAAAGGCEVVPVAALPRLQHLGVTVGLLASHLLPPLSGCKGLTCLTVDCSSDEQADWVAACCAGLHGPQPLQQLTGASRQLQQLVLIGVVPAAAEAAKQWVRGLVGRECSVQVCCT